MNANATPYVIDEVIKGKVTRIVTYGAFMDFPNGQSGLLHISEVSDRYVRDLHSVVSVGDEISVKVIAIDPANQYLRLSLKNIAPDADIPVKTSSRRKRIPIPEEQVDFSKLKENLPQWIETALKEEK